MRRKSPTKKIKKNCIKMRMKEVVKRVRIKRNTMRDQRETTVEEDLTEKTSDKAVKDKKVEKEEAVEEVEIEEATEVEEETEVVINKEIIMLMMMDSN